MKNYKILTTFFLLGLPLSGCEIPTAPDKTGIVLSKNETTQVQVITPALPELVIETASPDLAVKSWWKVLDLKSKSTFDECNRYKLMEKPAYIAYYPKVAQEDVLRYLTKESVCQEDVYERDIQEIKTESETRAIVFATVKNATPIPVGAEPDENEKKWRKDGERFKYLVEKTSEGWKISQVYKYEKYSEPEPWRKEYSFSDKPHYPALVYGLN
ncbi:MAG: hypothetical protein PHQ03_08830 [Methylococcales bacterium]|nr:hypothetical protein [Methylococcales bacterium]